MKVVNKLLFCILYFLLPLFSYAQDLSYRTSVGIEPRGGCAYLIIKYKNIGGKVMYFQPEDPAIVLLNSSRKVIPFIGIIVNRPPYSLDEYVKLQPGDVLERQISLEKSYGLRMPGKYTVVVNVDYFDAESLKGYEKGNIVVEFRYLGKCQVKN